MMSDCLPDERGDAKMTNHTEHRKLVGTSYTWTEPMLAILRAHFPRGGWRKVQAELATIDVHISKNAISNKAGRMRIKSGVAPKYSAYTVGETASKPEAPTRYAYDWMPLVVQERLPVRPGSMDFATIKSLSTAWAARSWPICKERVVDGRLEEYQIAIGVKVE